MPSKRTKVGTTARTGCNVPPAQQRAVSGTQQGVGKENNTSRVAPAVPAVTMPPPSARAQEPVVARGLTTRVPLLHVNNGDTPRPTSGVEGNPTGNMRGGLVPLQFPALTNSDEDEDDDLMDSSETTPGESPRRPVVEGGTVQQGVRDSEDLISAITQSTAKGCGGSKKSTISSNQRVSLKSVVKTDLFPKMKYVRGGAQLAYGSKAVKVIFEGLKMDKLPEKERRAWWTEEKMNFVRGQINIRRNNISGLLKLKFFGTCVRCCS